MGARRAAAIAVVSALCALAARTDRQMHDLFERAGFAEFEGADPASRDLDGWVKALGDKVHQITERLPCPSA
jgi:hypothetical protein